jgi:hypothetical protein
MKMWAWVAIIVAFLVAAAGLIAWNGLNRPSELPDFDSADFINYSYGAEADPPVTISGPGVAKLRSVFEGVPADRHPSKWVGFGQLRLLKGGRVVLEIDVFSNSSGAGPFRLSEKDYFLGYDQEAFRALLTANGWQPDRPR